MSETCDDNPGPGLINREQKDFALVARGLLVEPGRCAPFAGFLRYLCSFW